MMKNILLLLFSVIIMILVFEVVVAFFFPQEIVPNIIKFDNNTIFSLKKNYMGIQSSPEFRISLKTNSHGLRDVEHYYKKPDEVYRIIVVGDSFTFGDGVELNETFPKVLESELLIHNPSKIVKYEVINAGMYGWSTIQEYAFLVTRGLKYNPDMVILGFYENDFSDNIQTKDLVEFSDAGAKLINAKKDAAAKLLEFKEAIPLYDFFSQNSHLFSLTKKFVAISLYNNSKITKITDNPTKQNISNVTKNILFEFKRVLDKDNIHFVVVLIPSLSTVKNEIGAIKSNQDLVLRSFADWLKKNKFYTIDMLPIFKTHAAQEEKLYFPKDGHCTKKGQKLIGETIHRYFSDSNLL
jgi:hypothetical protein